MKASPGKLPATYRFLIWVAARLIPKRDREKWYTYQLKRLTGWWLWKNSVTGKGPVHTHHSSYPHSVIREAIELRFGEGSPKEVARRWARSPWVIIAVLVTALGVVLGATAGLSGVREAFAPLPYPESSRLVACFQLHFLSASLGAQSRYFRPWKRRSTTLEDLAAYRIRDYVLSGVAPRPTPVAGADVSPGFFALLGVKPMLGKVFEPDQSQPLGGPWVVVNHTFWKNHLGSNPRIEELLIDLDGEPHKVLGVMPAHFWFRSKELQVWTWMPEPGAPGTRSELMGIIGRLKPEATAEQAKEELQQIALRTPGLRTGPVRVLPLAEYQRPALGSISTIAGLSISLAALVSAIQAARTRRRYGAPWREPLRYWGFFLAKPAILITTLVAVCAEIASRNALGLHSGKFLLNLVLEWLVILGILLIFRWAILDQSRRCPVCLRRLALPARSGIWSSILIQPATTELLCDQGHGALEVAERGGTLGELRRWVTMEDAWRSLTGGSAGV